MLSSSSDSGSAGGPRSDALSADEQDQNKAKLDDTELNVGSPRAAQKVELDLDDAPFLEEEEAPPPPAEEIPAAPPAHDLGEPVKLPIWKNKKVLFGGVGGLLLLIGLAAWWFFIREVKVHEEPPPPPPPAPAPVEPPKPAEPPPPQDVFVPMEPFLVEKTDTKGAFKILSLKIKLVYKEDPRLAREIQTKSFALRDGLYYNLKNKSFTNLTDKDSVEKLREELRGVVNNYLNTGQIDQVLFEELLVK
ncbi:flagellar basal body-associated FliL family protein [Fundidesulfovibrio terrae]|uniref:flagellar basal body-associated FliL family protein n=1 Tax=Fundidesulfovibrio terrae TaxID=2922866 RepID=UPI001FAF695C|nr:flagellar basal body-associated FliL family protein [Fundidesulfovibrio terrae]